MRRRLADTGSNTVRHLRDKILDRKPLSIHFRVVDGHRAPPMSRCRRKHRGDRGHRPPSHNSKTVLSTVHVGGLTCTVDRTEASRATFSVARPAKKLSSGIGTTIPISQSTPKTELLLGDRSEEFRVGNEAEASSHLVWDVEGGLHPEEQPRVGLWLSEQFLLSADVFLQSFSSTPTVRPRQHVAIGLGNAVRELAVPAQVSGLW